MTRCHTVEFGAYEENGVLVAGWRLTGEAVGAVILQDNPNRSLEGARTQGPYLELDGHGAYSAVEGLSLAASGDSASVLLKHPATSVRRLDLPVPHSARLEERESLRQLVTSVGSFLSTRPLPTFHVDFNELVEPSLVLFSQQDERSDVRGHGVPLAEGMRVRVRDDNVNADGQRDDLVATGIVVPNKLGIWSHVKWLCMLDAPGIQHQSDLG